MAQMLGVTENAVRQLVKRKTLDPADLESVFDYIAKRRGWRISRTPG